VARDRSRAFETALSLIEAELTAEKVAEKIGKPVIEVRPVIQVKPDVTIESKPTGVIDMANERVEEDRVLLDEQGKGVLQKLLLRSPSKNFGIVLVTERTRIKGSYTHFEAIMAFEEDGVYVLELNDIEFSEKIRVVLTVKEAITFHNIFLKYKVAA